MTGVTFDIDHVNGVSELRFELGAPGVYVFRGRNGAGKTSAVNAVRAALGDKAALAEPTDGLQRGTVEAPGVKLVVGKTKRLNGQPSVQIADPSPLSRLIDPGIKESDRAARARIQALLEMVPLPVNQEDLADLCGGNQLLLATVRPGSDALALADRIRKEAQELARSSEARREQARGQLQAAEESLRSLGPKPELEAILTEDECQRIVTEAIREAEKLRISAEQRQRLEQQQLEVRNTLGEEPQLHTAKQSLKDCEMLMNRLREQLAVTTSRHEQLARRALEMEQAENRYRKQKEILQRPIEGATPEEVAIAEACVAAERRDAEQHQRARDHAEGGEFIKQAAQSVAELDGQARDLRMIAADLPTKLGEIIKRAGLPGVTVADGRIGVLQPDGSVLDFETRVSFGQRVRIALKVALRCCRRDQCQILALDPEFWTALDPERKREIADAARECGVWLLAEEPTDGELRVEQLETETDQP